MKKKTVTISYEYECDIKQGYVGFIFYYHWQGVRDQRFTPDFKKQGKEFKTITLNESLRGDNRAVYLHFDNSVGIVKVKNIKIELGSIPTPFVPHVND